MASHFQAARFSTKAYLFVSCLVVVILIAIAIVSSIIRKNENNHLLSHRTNTAQAHVNQLLHSTVDILFTTRHIEEGEKFEPNMLTVRTVNFAQLPEDPVSASEQELIFTKAASRVIDINVPLTRDMVAEPRNNGCYIPGGFVAATITIDSFNQIEKSMKPGTRVDVNALSSQIIKTRKYFQRLSKEGKYFQLGQEMQKLMV